METSKLLNFFGDRSTYKTLIENFLAIHSKESVGLMIHHMLRLKTQLYKKAIKELEIEMGIPPERSIILQVE